MGSQAEHPVTAQLSLQHLSSEPGLLGAYDEPGAPQRSPRARPRGPGGRGGAGNGGVSCSQGRGAEKRGRTGRGGERKGAWVSPLHSPESESLATRFADETRGHYFDQKHSSEGESLPDLLVPGLDSPPCPTLSFLLAVGAAPTLHPFLCPDRLGARCSQGEPLAHL